MYLGVEGVNADAYEDPCVTRGCGSSADGEVLALEVRTDQMRAQVEDLPNLAAGETAVEVEKGARGHVRGHS